MNNKDNILVWVNDASNNTIVNFTEFLSNRLNLSPTGVYIEMKNVQYLNTNSFNFDNIFAINNNSANTIIQNKILKISTLFMLIPYDHNNVKFSKNFINILMLLKKHKTPFLIIPNNCTIDKFNHIITAIDYSKKSKDRIMWANYLGRKLSSNIELLFPKEKDTGILNSIKDNIYFADKLLKKSQNNYSFLETENQSEKLIADSINLAETKNNATLILSTDNITILPHIFKPFEIKILNICRKNPVLFIPPNEDFLIPCH